MLKKLHLAGLGGMLLSGVSLILSPEVAGVLPPKPAAILTVIGIIWQGFTKGVQQGNTVLVKKSPTL